MFKRAITGLALVFISTSAYAQCSGQPPSGRFCGNPSASTTLPAWATGSAMFDRAFGSAQGSILNRNGSSWVDTRTPSLGLNGTAGGTVTLQGATTGSAAIGVNTNAGSTTFNLPVGNGTNGFVLITDGSGNTSWANNASGGTVTNVALALPSSILTVSGSPVTTTGTLTGTLATQSANLVWAGPTTGSAATPTFRSLVGADLPNPSSSSLGGVQSAASVSHQWINSISTSGVPALSQPAFTDISGTATGAQLPNPSATTLGGVESYAAVTNQWINAISTSGVPSSTQPNFTNIAGNASLGQLPSISNNSILANNSGGSSVPQALTTTNILDFIATTQGDVLYRNATVWVALAAGTNGQVLTSGGAAANPSWTTVTGTGTVTSIATTSGIAGGTITTTGTISLATITAGSVMANITGGSAVPIANTPSSILDLIGSTQGDILYRGASAWQVLAPGTNGQVLTQGASTPSWSNAGTLTNVTIAAGTGISVTGTCNISTTGTCTVDLTNPVTAALGGTGISSPTIHTIGINQGASAQNLVGPGTAGQSLISNGAGNDPSFKSGTRVLLNTLSPSSVATIQDTSSLTSTYNDYEIVIENMIPAASTSTPTINVITVGGVQSSTYASTVEFCDGGTCTIAGASTTSLPLCGARVAATQPGWSGTVRIHGPVTTANVKVFTALGGYQTASNPGFSVVGGYWNSTTALTGLQFSFGGSTLITSGTIKIYGMI